jgi:hypothetical protein
MAAKSKQLKRRPDSSGLYAAGLRIEQLTHELQDAQAANRELARSNARRSDQFRALLQVANLLLAVASNEIIDMEKLNHD